MNLPEYIERLHDATCSRKDNGYIDPRTGFFVLSAYYLKDRGYCCGAGCRHCPYPAEEQKRAGRPTTRTEEENNNGQHSRKGSSGSSTD